MIELLLLLFLLPVAASAFSKKTSYGLSIAASLVTAAAAFWSIMTNGAGESLTAAGSLFGLDTLSWYFLLVGAVSWLLTSLYSVAYDNYSRAVTAAYHMAVLSIVVVILSRSYLPFLIAWEGMSVSGYFLISYKKGTGRLPPYVFLVFGEVSALLILLMFTYFYAATGKPDFTAAAYSQVAVFAGLVGFLVKLGITPFQMTEWLPIAHGGAPVNGSVLFSATMTMASIYSILRILTFVQVATLTGGLLMAIGVFSLLFAAIYAASSEHVKMLPAYSTIENSGAMLILTGASVVSMNSGDSLLANFALAGVMVYVFAHTVSKTGLFLFAGVIERSSGTLDLNRIGGTSSGLFSAGGLLNALSLSGMLPFGGGLGEWMMLETLFVMVTFSSPSISVLSTFTGAMAALGAGITLVAMTKFYGYGGRVRRSAATPARTMTGPILAAGAISLLIGLAGIAVIGSAGGVTEAITGSSPAGLLTGLLVVPQGFLISSPGPAGTFGVVSPLFVAALLLIFLLLSYALFGRKRVRVVPVWNNGVAREQEPVSFAYANALRLTLRHVYPSGRDAADGGPAPSFDIFWEWLIGVSGRFGKASRAFALAFMNSDLSRYMLYLLIAFLAVLVYVIV